MEPETREEKVSVRIAPEHDALAGAAFEYGYRCAVSDCLLFAAVILLAVVIAHDFIFTGE